VAEVVSAWGWFVQCMLRSANSRTSVVHTAAMETDVLLLQVRGCETTFQLIRDKLKVIFEQFLKRLLKTSLFGC